MANHWREGADAELVFTALVESLDATSSAFWSEAELSLGNVELESQGGRTRLRVAHGGLVDPVDRLNRRAQPAPVTARDAPVAPARPEISTAPTHP